MNTRHQPDLAEIKGRQREAWASGDYAMFGATLLIMSELLCEAVDLRSGQRVLDVATGSGNTALAAARRFCEVIGIDYVPTLLERGRERAAAERLEVAFREGDAERIPFPDASFDVVLSTIGVMFAPDQKKAAGELLRVCRPGGKIGLANWTPDSFAGEMAGVFGRYVPPPPGLELPVLWGTEERLRDLLGGGVGHLRTTRRSFVFRYRSIWHYLESLQIYLGPTRKAFQSLDPAERENLASDLTDLVERFNESGDETMVVPSDYLEVMAIRR
ncbi:MAG: class I SAM-dependent methyltransferase [Actinomycetota bacterium]|nr:class I SAM-dependent methyltransferase [Actinomycetota bacterium]